MKVTLLNFGTGNLHSVFRALKTSGATDVVVSSDPTDVAGADRLVLPGVGAFKNGMQGLSERSLIEPIAEFAASGRPLLGICLGMQMLGTKGLEFGEYDGLDLIQGQIVQIPHFKVDGVKRIVPFVGWSKIKVHGKTKRCPSILDDVRENDSIYLTHSYQFNVKNSEDLLATYDYDDIAVTAAIKKDNITGLQFHPEKSGEVGLNIMRAFISE